MLVVSSGLHKLGHDRVGAIRADDNASELVDHRPPARSSADADDTVFIPEQIMDSEPLSQRRACGNGSISKDLVQYDPARRERRVNTLALLDGLAQREIAEVGGEGADRGAVRCDHGRQQAPAMQLHDPGVLNEVIADRVVGERDPLQQQNAIALPGEQHGRW